MLSLIYLLVKNTSFFEWLSSNSNYYQNSLITTKNVAKIACRKVILAAKIGRHKRRHSNVYLILPSAGKTHYLKILMILCNNFNPL